MTNEPKVLFERGNLFTGYPKGVWAEKQFGSGELHGPFSTENEANTYAHRLLEADTAAKFVFAVVVSIETPQIGKPIPPAKEWPVAESVAQTFRAKP